MSNVPIYLEKIERTSEGYRAIVSCRELDELITLHSSVASHNFKDMFEAAMREHLEAQQDRAVEKQKAAEKKPAKKTVKKAAAGIPCPWCDHRAKTKMGLSVHKSRKHQKKWEQEQTEKWRSELRRNPVW